MKKLIMTIILVVSVAACLASGMRIKGGINDYFPKLDGVDSQHGIYRLNGRLDVLELQSRLGAGFNLNLSFKSDNHNVDYNNFYDIYVHNLYGDKSSKGTYLVYGLLVGMRTCKVKAANQELPDHFGKITSTYTSLLVGAMLSRNDWGTEIMLSQNQQNNWKFDFTTKYNFIGRYFLEISYCHSGPVKEIEEDFSLGFGIELFNYNKK